MKYKTRAISLTYIKQGETSIISKVFTEEKGLQSFIIKGIRSKKSKNRLSYFEPFKLLNIDANFNSKKSLQYLNDLNIAENFEVIKNKMYKNFIAVFCSEVATKVLQENEQNISLFDFIWNTAYGLFKNEKPDPNFVLKYLLNTSSLLGFSPSKPKINELYFNMESGGFSKKKGLGNLYLDKENSRYLKNLLCNENIHIEQKKKLELINIFLQYYKLHHYNLDSVKSHLVIEALRK